MTMMMCLTATRARLAMAWVALLAIGGSASPAHAQSFGRNKVQYERFDFKVLATEHFDIHYYPEEEAAVRLASRMAERWYARLSVLLQHELSSRQPLILYAAHPHFQQTNVLAGEIGEGTGGVTEGARRRVIMPFAGGLAETDHVLGHELVHAFQYDISSQRDAGGRAIGAGMTALPLWFVEGMAEYLSLGPVDANTAMWVRDASARERMPTIDQLDDPDFFPYRYGHAFWAYVAGRFGDRTVNQLFRAAMPDADIKSAIAGVLGMDSAMLTRDWHAATSRTFATVFESARMPETFARPLVTRDGSGGELNVSPALSPDGRHLVFLSERSLFSIDMYVADVASGRVIRKLVETASDPHFDSLQFLSSAGDWAPDSRRFVFAALRHGQPVLTIVDALSGDRDSEHPFPDLGEIFNPAWAPDGRRVAFSALRGGVLDLYVFDVSSATLQRLTDDAFADLDPEWSPDGRSLAWVTDRFSSNLDTLSFGNYRIGSIDVSTRAIRELAGFERGRNTNPEFASDGRTLYFIGTPDGIPDLYRTGDAVTRITRLRSGVSGITPLTPALSVAAMAPTLAFTVFEEGRYNIYALSTSTPPVSQNVEPNERRAADVLPPGDRTPDGVARALASPVAGLPSQPPAAPRAYAPRLSLEAIGPPTVGAGFDQRGAYAAGGISFLFSDMLGDHTLGTTVQLTNRFNEIGGSVVYLNRSQRWNWGVAAQQTPYITGAFANGFATDGDATAFVQQSLLVTQVARGASALAQYPFSRVQRLELSGGLQRIGFDRRLETQFFSPVTGRFLREEVEELPSPDALTLGQASAALVYDSSIFGATSPVLGQRYRVEYTQLSGTLLFGGMLADYRRYFMPVRPFTVAIRGLHYGRYGRDAEDPRLSPITLGYPGMVRGYELNSFDATECAVTDVASCPAFDQLIGSRMALASVELRFPLLGAFSRRSFYGAFPIEAAVFTDAGVAWTRDQSPSFSGGDRDVVRSVGAAIRVNAFGYAIAEIDYVRPLDRPGRGWLWQFNLIPGF
jgi:Tol biopolymer transport system component